MDQRIVEKEAVLSPNVEDVSGRLSDVESVRENNIAFSRLEDQLQWYDKKSAWNKQVYKQLKLLALIVAASIPLFALKGFAVTTAAMGALIALIEGLQQLNNYHENWISYRSTAEALKHEKYLFLSKSGPYLSAENPTALLAERVESLVSQEHAKWASTQQQGPKKQDPKGQS